VVSNGLPPLCQIADYADAPPPCVVLWVFREYWERDRMGRSMIAMIALAAFGIALVVPDSVSARASGVSRGSRATALGSGLRGHPGGVFRHSGFPSGTFILRHGDIGRHGRAVGRRDTTFGGRRRGVAFGAAGFDASPGLYGSGDPACQVQRVQIDDLYGWRVRDVVVCPGGGISPQAGDPSASRLGGSPSGPREARPAGRLRHGPLPIDE
jgi:hypothetical protein